MKHYAKKARENFEAGLIFTQEGKVTPGGALFIELISGIFENGIACNTQNPQDFDEQLQGIEEFVKLL
jgi:hypothetical protein